MDNEFFKLKRHDDFKSLSTTNTRAFINEGKIVYVSRGSSSCPPIVEKVKQVGNEIYLTTKDYTGMICTADLRPVMQTIEYSNGDAIPQYTKIFLDGKQQN